MLGNSSRVQGVKIIVFSIIFLQNQFSNFQQSNGILFLHVVEVHIVFQGVVIVKETSRLDV